jgi:predicted RNA binding protein YcfA (HicA-like mRNA interferase family)
MKVPRDVDAVDLISLLRRYGYVIIKQTGSHVRLSKKLDNGEHSITVPNHKPIKMGTLQSIVKDICFANNLDANAFYLQL